MKDFLKLTEEFLNNNNIITRNSSFLLTVSGGIDSTVMLDVFFKLKINFAIAHCNFKLRGKESDKDQKFVKELAIKYKANFYTIDFETEKYAKDKGISTQMAARDLRYFWFEKIRSENNFDFIAVAHNKNDVAETILLNLVRGTGLKGLTGISPKNNNVIRPLLFASRDDIQNYQIQNNLKFREDSSNKKIKYKRNKIRHKVIPVLLEINPMFFDTMLQNAKRFTETYNIFNKAVIDKKSKIIVTNNNQTLININALKKESSPKTFLFEYLKPYNFTDSQLDNILSAINSESGKIFLSNTHKIVKDRDFFIISNIENTTDKSYFICKTDKNITEPINISIEIIDINKNFKLSRKNNIADFDFDILNFPLKLRKWRKGDFFMPLGMKRAKKLSDFFIDEKIPVSEKENIWILESKGEIVWIVGKRIDDRFKISKDTKKVLRLKQN